MNGFNSYNSVQQNYQNSQYFLQPQGNVYMINNSLEAANVPMGAGLSVALCPSEEIMYIKSIQNGTPCMIAYKILPYEVKPSTNQQSSVSGVEIEERFKKLEEQLESIKKQLTGGKISELL